MRTPRGARKGAEEREHVSRAGGNDAVRQVGMLAQERDSVDNTGEYRGGA